MSVDGGASQIAGQNIRKITEWIWKFWWFCFYYIILPGFCAALGYYIVPVFIQGSRVAIYSAVFVAILALLIFSQFFEKYRTRPPVQDNVALFDTYLHVMFVILLLSLILALIMPPSSDFLASIPYFNDVLGFISFATIFHLIWTYIYRGSIIEKVHSAPTPQFAAINAKFLNSWQAMVFFGTYLAQALYIQVFFAIPSVWGYALIPTAIIYLLTWQITKSERQFLREVLINGAGQFGSSKKHIKAGKGSLIDIDAASLNINLQRYLGKIVKLGIINSFALLVQICVTILIISPWGIQFGTVAFTVFSFLIGILGVIFGKVQFGLKIQYIGGEREPADRIDKVRRAQNANSFFTVVIIGIVTVLSFVITLPWLGLILLAGIAIITYYERLGGFHSKNARFIAISLAVAFSALISWGFLPVGWNLQLIMFPILLYFWLEGFGRKRLFNERDVKVTQNALAFVSLCAMLYYLYPAALQAYIFSTSSAIEAVANVLLICLFICGAFLTSLYQLYFFQFRGKSSRGLELALLATFAGILVIILALLNIQFSFLPTNDAFITAFAMSIAIAPIFFIGFAALNKKIGSISQKTLQACSYFASWVFLPPIFLLLIYVWGGTAGTCAGLLFLSIGFQALLLWTLRLHRLPEKQYKKITFGNSCFSVIVSFIFFYSLLSPVLAHDLILISIFLPLCITCTILGLLSFKLGIYPTSIAKWVTSGTLYFATFIVLYYSIYSLAPLLAIPYAILVIPLLTCLTVFVPHGFSRKAGILGRRAFQYLVKVNFLAMAVLVGYLPTAVSFDALLKGQEITLFMPILFSCLLFSVVFFIFSGIGATTGIYSRVESSLYSYYNSWICAGAITLLICIGVPSPFGFFLGLLIFSIIFYNLMKWSFKLGKLRETSAIKLASFTSYLGLDSVFCLIFFGFALILPQGGQIFSILCASVGTCVAIRYLGDKAKLFSPTIVALFVAGTLFLFAFVVCYYSFIWIFPSAFAWLLTPLFTCITLYVPVYYSAKGFEWKDETKSHVIAILGLIICACVVAIPTFVGIEIVRLGGSFPILGVLVFSFFLLYALLRLIIIDSPKSEKEHFYHTIQVLRVIFWMAVTVFTPTYVLSFFAERFAYNVPIYILLFSMIFFLMNAVTLMHLRFLNVNLRMLEIGKNVCYFGFNLAGSGVITLSILKILPSYALINSVLAPIMVILPLILFFAINLLLFGPIATWLNVSLSKWKERTELGSLVGFAASMGFLVILLVPTFSIFREIFLFIVVVSLFFPAALFYLEKSGIFVEKWTRRPELVLLFIFSFALLGLFADSFWNYGKLMSVFSDNLVLLVVLLCVVLLVIANFSVNLYNQLNRQISEMPPVLFSAKKYVIYFVGSGTLFVGLLFINPLATILLLPLTLGIALRVRNENIVWKLAQVATLSVFTFASFFMLLQPFIPSSNDPTYGGIVALIYLAALLLVFGYSAVINYAKKSLVEKFGVFSTITVIVFTSLITYTSILLLYALTISLVVFSAQVAIFLYLYHEKSAIWYARTCLVLSIFSFTSYLSYSFWFIRPGFEVINTILTVTMTASATGFAYVLLFNKLPYVARRASFLTVLIAVIVSLSTFFYFSMTTYFPVPLEWTIALAISLNIGILLFYVSTGIYQWSFSREIWEAGWWMWLFVPIVNFWTIYPAYSGVDVAANAKNAFGNLPLNGQWIFAIITCSLLYLPVIYAKIKDHFYEVLLAIWAESLFLVWWIASNLFLEYPTIVSSAFFGVFSVFLLLPLLYKLKAWRALSYIWIAAAALNLWFVSSFFYALQGGFSINIISLDLIVIGIFFLIYSFFPSIQRQILIAGAAYAVILSGIFLLIYVLMLPIVVNPIIAANWSFIIISCSLFASKYLKFNQKTVHFLIAVILIVNLSLLTLLSFWVPGLEFFATSLALAVFGGSFFLFNKYEMFKPVDERVPWALLALGTALSISALFLIFFQANFLLLVCIASTILLGFLYHYLQPYRYVLWFFFPIPITTFLLGMLLAFSMPVGIFVFAGIATYIAAFQLIFFIFRHFVKADRIISDKKYLEILAGDEFAITVYSVGFLINSVFIPLSIALITITVWFNQVLEFFILWDVFTLCSLKYLQIATPKESSRNFQRLFQNLALFLYYLVSLTAVVNIHLALLVTSLTLWDFIAIDILTFSGILLVEMFILDNYGLKLVFQKIRNQHVLWAWLAFGNILSIYLFSFHANLFLMLLMVAVLNLPSCEFLARIERERYQKTSNRLRFSLQNAIFVLLSMTFASIFVPVINDALSVLLFATIFSITWFGLNTWLNGMLLPQIKRQVSLWVFIGFQAFLAAYWITLAINLNGVTFYSIWLLVLCETGLLFYSLPEISKLFFPPKNNRVQPFVLSTLKISFTLEVSFLFLGVFLASSLGVLPSFILSQCILFGVTAVEIPVMNAREKPFMYFLHTISSFTTSVGLFAYLSIQFWFWPGLWIQYFAVLLLLVSTQLYTTHSLFATYSAFNLREEEFIKNRGEISELRTPEMWDEGIRNLARRRDIIEWAARTRSTLYNILFILVPLYLALNFSELLQLGFPTIDLYSLTFLSIGTFCLLYYGMTEWFNQNIPSYWKRDLEVASFGGFQVFLACAWFSILTYGGIFLPSAISLLVLVETLLLVNFLRIFSRNSVVQQALKLKRLESSWIFTFVYLELAIMVFTLCSTVLPLVPSLFLASLTLFVLSAIESNTIKQAEVKLIRGIQAGSYSSMSLFLFLSLLTYILQMGTTPLLGLVILLFTFMQFYTNYAVFTVLKLVTPDREAILSKRQADIQNILGLFFYACVLFFLQQNLANTIQFSLSLSIQFQILVLSLAAHAILLFDARAFKFIREKYNRPLLAVSWAGFIIAGLMVTLASSILTVSIGLIPVLILITLIELAYFPSMLGVNRSKLSQSARFYKILTLIAYGTVAAWLWFFVQANTLIILGVILGSAFILLGCTYVDESQEAFPARVRLDFRYGSGFTIVAVLSGYVFIIMQDLIRFFANALELSLSVTLLVFTLFLVLIIRPFRKESRLSLVFWLAIFILLGFTSYYIWSSISASAGLIAVAVLLYPFIFIENFRKRCIAWLKALGAKFVSLLHSLSTILRNGYVRFVNFCHVHFMGVWTVVSLASGGGAFVIANVLMTINVLSAIPISTLVFFLVLYGIFVGAPETKKEELKSFQNDVLYYGAIYAALAWSIFSFFPRINVFLLLAVVLLFGGVLLVFIFREEKRGKISIYWRFATTLIFIALAFVMAVLIVLQVVGAVSLI